jgi:hypothetical protein
VRSDLVPLPFFSFWQLAGTSTGRPKVIPPSCGTESELGYLGSGGAKAEVAHLSHFSLPFRPGLGTESSAAQLLASSNGVA